MPVSRAFVVLLLSALIVACDNRGSHRPATEDTVDIPYYPAWKVAPPLRPTGREGTLESFEATKWLSSFLYQHTLVIDSAAFSIHPSPWSVLRGTDSQINVVGCEVWLHDERYWLWITSEGRVVEIGVVNGEAPMLRHGTIDISYVRQVFSLTGSARMWSFANRYAHDVYYVFGHNPRVLLYRVTDTVQKIISIENTWEKRIVDGDTGVVEVGFRNAPAPLWALFIVLDEHVRDNVKWTDSATIGKAYRWGGDG